MNKQNVIIVLVISIFLSMLTMSSCKDNSNNKNVNNESLNNKNVFNNDIVQFEFDFPDTVYIDKLYSGKIKYKGILDSITTSFEDDKNSRYITFYMIKTQNLNFDVNELHKVEMDTFGAVDNNTIPFYNIKFSKLGTNYISGIINDHVTLDMLNNKKARYIENIHKIKHKVFVVEKLRSPKISL
ncbi:hypothetical protein [Flavobacterium sp. UBA7680]|uniref:hypothetical protein n=1 Tax=Flavobacterium sp. UBA7680 TaxID=1946559 RepID=UPI0025C72835|nr:hypothetical protein [Flavobacterium sp. UBA7680]